MVLQHRWARVAGVALLLIIVFGLTSMAVEPAQVVGAAAQGPTAHEAAFRLSLVCSFLMLNNDVLLAAALYGLLAPVDGTLALLGSFWRIANAALLGAGVAAGLTGLRSAGLEGPMIASPLFHLPGSLSFVGLWFWSLGAAAHSVLLWRSGYIPKVLSGAYLIVAVAIFLGCLVEALSPATGRVIDPWFVLPDLPVELAVGLWMAFRGARLNNAA